MVIARLFIGLGLFFSAYGMQKEHSLDLDKTWRQIEQLQKLRKTFLNQNDEKRIQGVELKLTEILNNIIKCFQEHIHDLSDPEAIFLWRVTKNILQKQPHSDGDYEKICSILRILFSEHNKACGIRYLACKTLNDIPLDVLEKNPDLLSHQDEANQISRDILASKSDNVDTFAESTLCMLSDSVQEVEKQLGTDGRKEIQKFLKQGASRAIQLISELFDQYAERADQLKQEKIFNDIVKIMNLYFNQSAEGASLSADIMGTHADWQKKFDGYESVSVLNKTFSFKLLDYRRDICKTNLLDGCMKKFEALDKNDLKYEMIKQFIKKLITKSSLQFIFPHWYYYTAKFFSTVACDASIKNTLHNNLTKHYNRINDAYQKLPLKYSKDLTLIHYAIALCYASQASYEEALRWLDKGDVSSDLLTTLIYYKMNKMQQARKLIKRLKVDDSIKVSEDLKQDIEDVYKVLYSGNQFKMCLRTIGEKFLLGFLSPTDQAQYSGKIEEVTSAISVSKGRTPAKDIINKLVQFAQSGDNNVWQEAQVLVNNYFNDKVISDVILNPEDISAWECKNANDIDLKESILILLLQKCFDTVNNIEDMQLYGLMKYFIEECREEKTETSMVSPRWFLTEARVYEYYLSYEDDSKKRKQYVQAGSDAYTQALELLEQVVQTPDVQTYRYNALYDFSEFLMMHNKGDQALEELKKINSLRLSKLRLLETSYLKACIHYQKEDLQAALREIRKAYTQIPGASSNNTEHDKQSLFAKIKAFYAYLIRDSNFELSYSITQKIKKDDIVTTRYIDQFMVSVIADYIDYYPRLIEKVFNAIDTNNKEKQKDLKQVLEGKNNKKEIDWALLGLLYGNNPEEAVKYFQKITWKELNAEIVSDATDTWGSYFFNYAMNLVILSGSQNKKKALEVVKKGIQIINDDMLKAQLLVLHDLIQALNGHTKKRQNRLKQPLNSKSPYDALKAMEIITDALIQRNQNASNQTIKALLQSEGISRLSSSCKKIPEVQALLEGLPAKKGKGKKTRKKMRNARNEITVVPAAPSEEDLLETTYECLRNKDVAGAVGACQDIKDKCYGQHDPSDVHIERVLLLAKIFHNYSDQLEITHVDEAIKSYTAYVSDALRGNKALAKKIEPEILTLKLLRGNFANENEHLDLLRKLIEQEQFVQGNILGHFGLATYYLEERNLTKAKEHVDIVKKQFGQDAFVQQEADQFERKFFEHQRWDLTRKKIALDAAYGGQIRKLNMKLQKADELYTANLQKLYNEPLSHLSVETTILQRLGQ